MSDTVIKVENLSKKYLIRHQQSERYTALRDVIANKAKSLGKKLLRPLALSAMPFADSFREDFWALKGISFEVKQGDRIGIIGRNGAGKTTLLKLLSRITEPTAGRIAIKGRVASLLEVGTGFHPELTGRENIFLNGAILGMSKAEIKKTFEEIVDFAEIEKFLDTPVKRYSSGMYVRLAFAIAAHLEPEILLVDEVLAVGDAQFQKKSLGKMGDVTKEGRTVLFVSHNMGAITRLCNTCILLERGKLCARGFTDEIVSMYLASSTDCPHDNDLARRKEGNQKIVFTDFFVTDTDGNRRTLFLMGETIRVSFSLLFNDTVKNPIIAIEIRNILNEPFAHIINLDDNFLIDRIHADNEAMIQVEIPQVYFTPSTYVFSLWVGEDMSNPCDYLLDCMHIELQQGNALNRIHPYPPHVKLFLESNWKRIK